MSNIEITPQGWAVLDDDHLSCSQDVRKHGRIDYDSFGSIDLCRPYLKEGSTVIDVGAHIGCWTVPMVQAVGISGHVYAFEADPEPYACLRNNVDRVGTAHLFNAAIWRTSGEIKFLRNAENRGCSCVSPGDTGGHVSFSMESIALDDLHLNNVSFIKIDVEGSELECLTGSVNLIKEQKPVLFIETIGIAQGAFGRTLDELYGWLLDNKYTLTFYPSEDITHDVLCT